MPPKGTIPKKSFFKKRNKRPKAGLKSVKKKFVKQIVNETMDRKLERKQIVYANTIYPSVIQSTSTSIAGNYLVMTPSNSLYGPSIARGTTNNNFIGNKYNIVKYTHTLVLCPTPYNSTTNTQVTPCYVKVYYFKSKQYPTADLTVNLFNTYGQFFAGGAADIGFAGSLMDLTRKIQSENYTYLTSKTYKIGPSAPPTTSGTTTYHPYSNNDFQLSVIDKIDLTEHFKSPIKVNDANITTTPWVFFIVQCISATGNVLATSQLPIQIQNEMNILYTDE